MGFKESYDEIYGIARDIYLHPELGYKEYRTSEIVEDFVLKYITGINKDRSDFFIEKFSGTGIKINFPKVNERGLNMVFMAELDAVYTPTHFHSDKNTGAAHNCGHYSQVAIALSLFKEFVITGDYKELDYNISFVFVPAEEFLDLEYRKSLKEEGKIKYYGGKTEGMRLGIYFIIAFLKYPSKFCFTESIFLFSSEKLPDISSISFFEEFSIPFSFSAEESDFCLSEELFSVFLLLQPVIKRSIKIITDSVYIFFILRSPLIKYKTSYKL